MAWIFPLGLFPYYVFQKQCFELGNKILCLYVDFVSKLYLCHTVPCLFVIYHKSFRPLWNIDFYLSFKLPRALLRIQANCLDIFLWIENLSIKALTVSLCIGYSHGIYGNPEHVVRAWKLIFSDISDLWLLSI